MAATNYPVPENNFQLVTQTYDSSTKVVTATFKCFQNGAYITAPWGAGYSATATVAVGSYSTAAAGADAACTLVVTITPAS